MNYFAARLSVPAWKMARVLVHMLGNALNKCPTLVWNGAPPGLVAGLLDLGKPLSAPDEDESDASAAQRLASGVRDLRGGWRCAEGYLSTEGASFEEALAARALGSIETCAAAGASGNELLSSRSLTSAAFYVGAVLARAGFDVDEIAKAALQESGRNAARIRHANDGRKAKAKALWDKMRITDGVHEIALAIDSANCGAYASARKWITAWRKEARTKPP